MRPALLFMAAVSAIPAQRPTIDASGETMRLRGHYVGGSGSTFSITLDVDDDNGYRGLPASARRWWHCEINGLDPANLTSLHVEVVNAGYTDVILPAWSLSADGATFAPYARVPVSATPAVSGSTHRFTLEVPAGIRALRLAKYFPYPVAAKNQLLGRIAGHRHVRELRSLGTSWYGRPIELIEITDDGVSDAGKHRVWIQAGIQPAETTGYFVIEGLIDELLSGDAHSELLLDHLIFDIVPMPNPDGVAAGNDFTNARSVDLGREWAAPYESQELEVIALRTAIESFMSTHAIEAFLDLHTSHDTPFPALVEHLANPSFDPAGDRSGVIPAVRDKQELWNDTLRSHSAWVARGTTQTGSLGAPQRPFVEAMLHDRWSAAPLWTGTEVMATQLRGSYGLGPDGSSWNTAADYRAVGVAIARALGAYFDVGPSGAVIAYGASCHGPTLAGALDLVDPTLTLVLGGAAPSAPGWTVYGLGQASVPLPPPTGCLLRTDLIVAIPFATDPTGAVAQTVPIPPWVTAVDVRVQGVVADLRPAAIAWQTTNGVHVVFERLGPP